MKTVRIISAVAALLCGMVYLFLAYAFIGWGWSDTYGGWSPVQWTITVAIASLPLLFSLWIAYRCLNSSLKWTAFAGTLVLIASVLAFKVWSYSMRDLPILVESAPPLATTRDPGTRPHLPLSSPAAGIAAPDGKFLPMLALNWPAPGWGFATITYLPGEAPPIINVYRGTNDLATNNQFLGIFQILALPKSKTPIDVMLLFHLSEKKELLLSARDTQHKSGYKLQRLPTP